MANGLLQVNLSPQEQAGGPEGSWGLLPEKGLEQCQTLLPCSLPLLTSMLKHLGLKVYAMPPCKALQSAAG